MSFDAEDGIRLLQLAFPDAFFRLNDAEALQE